MPASAKARVVPWKFSWNAVLSSTRPQSDVDAPTIATRRFAMDPPGALFTSVGPGQDPATYLDDHPCRGDHAQSGEKTDASVTYRNGGHEGATICWNSARCWLGSEGAVATDALVVLA